MENIETLLAAVAQTTGFGDEEPLASTPSELGLGNSAVARDDGFSGDVRPVGGVVADLTVAVPLRGRVNGGVEKRKRGRPPKGQVVVKPPPVKRVKVEEEEEDVCFICFDGGSLVLCDRKGCPKAYHPACIKRDEAFFNTKAKWNCGWHICSVCRKSSHYLCYTCTYSLCKGCTKDADYVAVRGNNGFCSTCMKTIMLIENKGQANNESIQVDFDDKLSWEYLFKMYWVLLKEKLSLTMTELTQAKSPWKGVAAVTRKPRLNYMRGEGSISCKTEHLELNKPHVECNSTQIDGLVKPLSSNGNHVDTIIKNTADKPVLKNSIHESCIKKDLNDPSIDEDSKKTVNTTDWASNDLLEFVKHMKNGDASALSLFDVQILLVDYIKRNNLWDADQKSQIVCDQRLKKLFGRQRVDYVETLKLLESHFLAKEGSSKDSFVPAGVVKSDACESSVKDGANSRKRKTRRKNEDRAAQFGSNKYAAINAHNVNLIYLRRNLVETLLEYHDNFDDKVIGSIVRIRISADDQKPEVHRLVQVTGTSKAAEPYKIGNRTADVMLEVLNLDRKEVVSIVAISNEEFTEDECKWLRQSIRCGLVKQFTVDEVKKKAMALQSVRVNDWLEAEILRLNHLRDQAGEKGIKKELGECVDRLQLLKSSEERQHRISEVPEIHSDPKMNPNYESDEDTRSSNLAKKDRYVRPSYSPLPRNDWEPLPSNEKGKEERSIEAQAPIKEKTDASESNDSEKCTNHIDIATPPAVIASVENSAPADNIETEKLWHYRDPNSKIQGPFSMMELRKRSTTGLFPPDMRIWTNHEQYDSLLLLDALNGKFHGAPEWSHKSASQENRPITSEGESGSSRDSKPTEVVEPVKADEASSGWPRCWDLLKDGSPSSDGVKVRNLLPSSNSETRDEALTDRVGKRDEVNQDGENSSTGTIPNPINEVQNQPNDEVRAGQSLNIDLSSNGLESMPVLEPSSTKPTENIDVLDLLSPTAKTEIPQPVPVDIPVQNTGFLELLSPAPRSNNEDPGTEETDPKQSGFVNLPISNPGWVGPSSQPIWGDVTDEWCAKWDSGEHTNTPATDAPTSIPASNGLNWLTITNEPIEIVALGEDSVSDLLAEVDAMESLGASLPSPTAAIKFAREFLEDCKDDCFSSIEDFGSTPEPRKSDAFSSTSDVNLTSQSSAPCNKPSGASPVDAFDFFRRSTANSSASSEGETSAAVHSGDAGSEFHPPGPQAANQVMVGSGSGPDPTDPGWGQQMQGNNINMVTVQGNVNLVLGGPTQGMANLGWGANPGPGWVNPSSNRSPRSGSLPWDGQRKYGGERFNCPREWGYQGVRPPWGRPPYGGGGGGYSRPIPKGQRVCKFYESGHCKKGAHCDYLHP